MEISEIQKMAEIEEEHWWFKGKRALVKSFLPKSGLLLDIGSGGGANLKEFSRVCPSIGMDFSKDALEFCRKNVSSPLVRCSGDTLPFQENSFTVVTILDVLEHLDRDVNSLKEINRILKPKGKLIITVPAHRFLWHGHDVLLHHKRRYSLKELETKLLKSGFKVKKLSYWNFLLFPLAFAYKLLNKGTDTSETNRFLNKILYGTLSVDNFLIKRLYLPLGVSIFCVAEK